MENSNINILIIYTGGTIGMINDPVSGCLRPFNFDKIHEEIPELKHSGYNLSAISFDRVIDSSNFNCKHWVNLAKTIKNNYDKYDGFVILHGTDTMAYTASVLSFMLENQSKPVILTGSQIPIEMFRTDAKNNLISSLEIAAAKKNNSPIVPEVCIYFENKLFRGNRTSKKNVEHFDAFSSDNYPLLAEAGIKIVYNHPFIHHPKSNDKLKIYTKLNNNVGILKLFPGINKNYVESVLQTKQLKGLVFETFGSGNGPTDKWFINILKDAVDKGLIIVNVTQCNVGNVEMERYETGVELMETGIINGYDMTTEAAITKLMFLLGNISNKDEIIKYIKTSISGELTIKDI